MSIILKTPFYVPTNAIYPLESIERDDGIPYNFNCDIILILDVYQIFKY